MVLPLNYASPDGTLCLCVCVCKLFVNAHCVVEMCVRACELYVH